MLPAFFASKTAIRIREKLTLPLLQKGIKSLPHQGGKKILIRNHQFVRLLDTAYIAYKFQFFSIASSEYFHSLPPHKAKSSGRVGKNS